MKNELLFAKQVLKGTNQKRMNISKARLNYSRGGKICKLDKVRNKQQQPLFQPIISGLTPFTKQLLEILPYILDKTLHLSHSQRIALPDDIHNLSCLLTSERKGLYKSYWSNARFCSAYLWYFFPWNLIRLTSLISNLALPEPKSEVVIMDLGSGPLTLPVALWLSKPTWRNCKIKLICVDTAIQPMNIGLKLFKQIAAQLKESFVWDVTLIRGNYTQVLKSISSPLHLIMSGNMLNELKGKTNHLIRSRMEQMVMLINNVLHSDGAALFVEPGTRLGGKLMSTLREVAIQDTFISIAPCTHTAFCPLFNSTNNLWCHVLFDVDAPRWLLNLSQAAKLSKVKVSFSFQLLRYRKNTLKLLDNTTSFLTGRVLSGGFPVLGMGTAQYVCTKKGLALMSYTRGIPSGARVLCKPLPGNQRDIRSGALKVEWVSTLEKE